MIRKSIFLIVWTLVSLLKTSENQTINRPIRLAYVNILNSWWPAEDIAAGLGVPGYASDNIYNYIALTFWSCGNRVFDTVKTWDDPIRYIGA